MGEQLIRAQILLNPQQRSRLEAIARREGKSISAVTRQVIDAGLRCMESEAEVWKNRAQILSNLREIREQQAQEYTGNLVDEIRQEREDEDKALWGYRPS